MERDFCEKEEEKIKNQSNSATSLEEANIIWQKTINFS